MTMKTHVATRVEASLIRAAVVLLVGVVLVATGYLGRLAPLLWLGVIVIVAAGVAAVTLIFRQRQIDFRRPGGR